MVLLWEALTTALNTDDAVLSVNAPYKFQSICTFFYHCSKLFLCLLSRRKEAEVPGGLNN